MKWQAAFVASLISSWVCAQTPPAPGAGESQPKDRVTQRAEDMREQIVKGGRQVKSHVRVALRLKNGNKLIGVVKDGRLVERVDGLRFVDAQAKDRGAGIRLWYSGGTRSYIFIPFRDLSSYEVLQRLSNKQLIELEQEMQMAERRAAAERAAQARAEQQQKADEAGDGKPGKPGEQPAEGGEGEGAEPAESKMTPAEAERARQEAVWAELLKKYPPSEGWNEAKRGEISRRQVVIGAVPSKHELEFVERFDEWRMACEHAGIDPNAPVQKDAETKREQRKKEIDRLRGRTTGGGSK